MRSNLRFGGHTTSLRALVFALSLVRPGSAGAYGASRPDTVQVHLSEWKVELAPAAVPPGPVAFRVTNAGSIPHALEVEGRGVEKRMSQLDPGRAATLVLDLKAGDYEVYCPVGKGSHKMLGMMSHVVVGKPTGDRAANRRRNEHAEYGDHEAAEYGAREGHDEGHEKGARHGEHDREEPREGATTMRVQGGGPVIQIFPGPYPFADSAEAIIRSRPADQRLDLEKKAHLGPYSNNVAAIDGDISLFALDHGASGDSVSGTARFTAQDGRHWRVEMDRVQTKDIPFNPRFGGVIMGLFYHGASGVHTPLVPTIQSSLALWAFARLYRDEQLVTDHAMVHVMLLSRTRRPSDWALDCWDCSDRPIQELQLQVTPAPDAPPFDSPGGFLFVNWEKSTGSAEPPGAGHVNGGM